VRREQTSRDIADLAPDPRNPRRITAEAAAGLGESLRRFGDIAGITWNRRTGHLVTGHQRIAQLRAAGATEWIVDGERRWIEHPATGERFSVRVVDWDEQTERQANIAANNPSIGGEFTEDALRQLEELASQEVDLGPLRLDVLMDELAQAATTSEASEPDGPTAEDEAPAAQEATVSRPGDLWMLGRHRLLCADCTDPAAVAKSMSGETADVCLTDPPYGVGLGYRSFDDSEEAARALAARWLPLAREAAHAVVFSCGIREQWLYPCPDWVLCWFYGAGPFPSPWGFNCWTPFLAYGKDPRSRAGRGSWPDALNLNVPANAADIDHPCPKPVALWGWMIKRLSTRGQTILDVFAGSGTTLIAAEQLGRIARLVELDPHYCDVIIRRWQRLTGRKATREDGAAFDDLEPAA
jgi:DNA modification methylase